MESATALAPVTKADRIAVGARDVYLQLRALMTAHEEGWCRYIAGELAEGLHVVDIGDVDEPHCRTLIRDEAYWWCQGLGDGYEHGNLIELLQLERLPDLLTIAEAAAVIPSVDRWEVERGAMMTVHGVDYLLKTGAMYPLYGVHRVRHLFKLQVQAEIADRRAKLAERAAEEAQTDPDNPAGRKLAKAAKTARDLAKREHARWLGLRGLLPPVARPRAVSIDTTPLPSPDPLPIPVRQNEPTRRVQALMTGHNLGWFEYLYPLPPEAEGGPAYVVRVKQADGQGQERAVPAEHVLAWVLGVADRRRASARVAYRPDLG